MKVLIVDDNARVRWLIKSIIGDLADQFYECADGDEAVDTYTKLQPDWVLMDIRMNEMDGIIATTQIKAAFADAKILIVTDYDDDDLREAAMAAGASGYVLKENLNALRRILKKESVKSQGS